MEDTFGDRLILALLERKMKQKELARMVGMTETTISRYINDQRMPDIVFLEKAAVLLNVSADFLLGVSDDMSVRHRRAQ